MGGPVYWLVASLIKTCGEWKSERSAGYDYQ